MKKWVLAVLVVIAFVSVAVLAQLQGELSENPLAQYIHDGKITIPGGSWTKELQNLLFPPPAPKNYTTFALARSPYPTLAIEGTVHQMESSGFRPPDPIESVGSLGDALRGWWDQLWTGAKPDLGRIASFILFDWWTGNAAAVNCNVAGGACFWVGGTGNFSDGTHWSNSTGGANCGCTPTTTSTVTFDASSGAGTATQNNATFTSGAVTMDNSSVTVSGSSNTWNVGGNWSDINGKFSFSTSTVIANATGSWNMKGAGDQGNQHFNIWEVANGVTATLSQSLGAAQVIMLGTSTITGSSKSITLGTAGGGTSPFQCLATSTVNVGVQYNNATNNTVIATACSYAASSSSFTGALRINGSFTYLLGGTLNVTSTLGMAVTDANGATTLNTQNNTISDSGPLLVDDAGGGLVATLTAGTSSVTATSFTLGSAADHDGVVTSNGTWTISGAITGYGTWTANASTIKVAGNFNWGTTNGATFTFGTSTIEFTGSGTLTLPTGNGNATSYNITIDASVTMTIGARVGIQNAVVINGTLAYNSSAFDIRGANTTPITFGASGTQSGSGTLSFLEDGAATTITISAHTDYPSIRFEPVTSNMLFVLNGTTTFAALDFLVINTGSTLSTQNNTFNTGPITTTVNGAFGLIAGTSTVTTGWATIGASIYFTSSAAGSWTIDLTTGNYTNNSTSASWSMSAPVTFISTSSRTVQFCGTGCGGGTEFLGNVTMDQKTGGTGVTYTMGAALAMGLASNPGLTLTVQRSVGTGTVTLTTSGSNFAISTSSVVVSANGILTANASTITVQSAGVTNTGWNTSAGTFNAGTSTVILFCNGSVSTATGSTSVSVFYNLTWQAGNSLVLSTSTGISNILTVSVSGTVNAGSGPTIFINSSNATPLVWSTSRIWANIYLNASTAYTLPTNGTYGGNLTVGGSATATLGAALLMDGANHASTLTVQDTATLNTSAANSYAITLSTGVVGITVGTGGTLVPNTSVVSLTGSWDSSGGTVNAANFGTAHNQYTANFNGTGAYTIKTGDAVGGFGNGGNETFWNLNINSGTSVTLLLASFGVYAANSIYVNAPIIAGSPYASVSFWGIFTSACKTSQCVAFGPSANMQQSGFFTYIPNSWSAGEHFHITPGTYNSLELNAVCNSVITTPIDCANPGQGSQMYLDGNITMVSNGTGFTDGEFILRTAQSFAMFDFYQNGFNVIANGDVFVGDTNGASVRYHVGTGTLTANDGLAPIGPAILYMDSGTVTAYPVTVYAPVALYLNFDSGYSATVHGGTGTLNVHGKLRFWTNGGNNASVIFGENATINIFADVPSGAYGQPGDFQIDDAPGYVVFGASKWTVYGITDTTADFRSYSTSSSWSCQGGSTLTFAGSGVQTILVTPQCLPNVVVNLSSTVHLGVGQPNLKFTGLTIRGAVVFGSVTAGSAGFGISLSVTVGSTATIASWNVWAPNGPNIDFPITVSQSGASLTITVFGMDSLNLGAYKDGSLASLFTSGGGGQQATVDGPWSTHDITVTSGPCPQGQTCGGGGGGGGGNPPQATLTYTVSADGVTYTFTVKAPTGYNIKSVTWIFGDGGSGSGNPVVHSFLIGPTYTIQAQVTYDTGYSAPTTTTITPLGPVQGIPEWLPLLIVFAAVIALVLVFVSETESRRIWLSIVALVVFWAAWVYVAAAQFPSLVPKDAFAYFPLATGAVAGLMTMEKQNKKKGVWVLIVAAAVVLWFVLVLAG